VDGERVRQRMLSEYDLRVEDEMSDYVARRLAAGEPSLAALPVIGGNARTGMPTRLVIDPRKLFPGRP
jgi:hypothetical protein